MRITEKRLRSIIRNIIREAEGDDERYPADDPRFAPFDDELEGDLDDELYDDMEIIDADDISALDQPASKRGWRRDGSPEERETREFMARNRRAGAERDRGDRYVTSGYAHASQLDMPDVRRELGAVYDDDGNELEQ